MLLRVYNGKPSEYLIASNIDMTTECQLMFNFTFQIAARTQKLAAILADFNRPNLFDYYFLFVYCVLLCVIMYR